MNFPIEIERLIKEFAQPCAATTRPNWRDVDEWSGARKAVWRSGHMNEYIWDSRTMVYGAWAYAGYDENACEDDDAFKGTWAQWCIEKRLIGPPRPRGDHEIMDLDDDYHHRRLTDHEDGLEEMVRYSAWINTWPAPDDLRWVKARGPRGVPEWAKAEFNNK